MRLMLAGLMLAVGCGLPMRNENAPSPAVARMASEGFKPKRVASARVEATVVTSPFAADTLVSTVSWTNPVEDGKGPLDSLKVQVTALSATVGALPAHSVKFLAPFPTQTSVRNPLPFRDASWGITAQVCTYRGSGANSATCVSVSAAPYVYSLSAPPPVTGATVTNVKVP